MTARTLAAPMITSRRWMIALTTLILVGALIAGVTSTLRFEGSATGLPYGNKLALSNVRDYAAAASTNGMNYAVDGGLLYAGRPLDWNLMPLPAGVIANAVAVDPRNPAAVYVGAANELALYRSTDGGDTWLYVPLTENAIGAVTDVAVDGENRLIYVGTDTTGIFRLRDVGSSLTSGGHFTVDEPVVEVAADSTGAGMAFFRTSGALYRSENGGLAWSQVKSLSTVPTAIEVANSRPPVVYVGTVERGVLSSADGVAWMSANDGLNVAPGTRVSVDALAVDPQQPNVLYAATSYLYGSTTLHKTPAGVAMSRSGGEWSPVVRTTETPVAELLPVSGQPGAVYALLANSRTPLALGVAPAAPVAGVEATPNRGLTSVPGMLAAWVVAVLAALWLTALVAAEYRRSPAGMRPAPQMLRHNR